MHPKEPFRDIVPFLNNMDEYRRKRFMRQLFKAVGDRAGPDISESPHNDGELLCRHTLEPVGSILRSMLNNAYQNIKEKK